MLVAAEQQTARVWCCTPRAHQARHCMKHDFRSQHIDMHDCNIKLQPVGYFCMIWMVVVVV